MTRESEDTIAGVARARCWGLVERRERWGLSLRGRIFLAVASIAVGAALLLGVHPFLAVSDGGRGEIMVVEGWIGARRSDRAAAAFKAGRYRSVVVVRDVYEGGNKWTSGRYTADYVAADLVEGGVPSNLVHIVFCPVVRKDRTYHCAKAAREWLTQRGEAPAALDVVTIAAHARRSRLMYQKAFGDAVRVGVVALEDPTYDPGRWWQTSPGVREVSAEAIAYLYARLFFWPKVPAEADPSPPPGNRGTREGRTE